MSGSRGHGHARVRRVVRVEGIGQELRTQKVKMIADGKGLGFSVEMGNVGHEDTTRDRAEGFVLDALEGGQICGADMGVPNWCCVCDYGFDQGLVCEEKSLLLVTPG